MDENKTTQGSDPTTDFCCSSLTTKQMLAARLRDVSYHVSEMDRCTLCKAAEELEKKPEKSGFEYALPILTLMLFGGFGGGHDIDPDGMKAYLDAVEKKQNGKTTNGE